MAAADAILRKWLAPALVGGAAATQSEDSEGSIAGILSKGASLKGAKAAHDVFKEHIELNPRIFTNFESLIESGAMQADAARRAGNSRQGWFIGADGKPRYEISDKNAAIDGSFTKGVAQMLMDKMPEGQHFPVPLGKFLTHDSLFNAYPDMYDMPVMLRHPRDMGDAAGAYHHRTDEFDPRMSLNLQYVLDNDRNELVKTVMHEAQHGIQDIEGFARGAGTRTALYDIKDYVRNPQRHGAINNMPNIYSRLQGPKIDKFYKIIEKGEEIDRMNVPPGALGEAVRDSAKGEIDLISYLMSAGEAEARSVEDRLRMPAKLRASDHGHPYGDMRIPTEQAEYFYGDGKEGPTLFQMIEMMTRDAL